MTWQRDGALPASLPVEPGTDPDTHTFIVPDVDPGPYTVTIGCSVPVVTHVVPIVAFPDEAMFTVPEPDLRLTPLMIEPGKEVEATGTGFPVGCQPRLTGPGFPIPDAVLPIPPPEVVTVRFTVPADMPPGVYTLRLDCGKRFAEEKLEVLPTPTTTTTTTPRPRPRPRPTRPPPR